MANRSTMLDEVANDLALWLDQTANEIALAFAPHGAPFAAKLSEKDKLEYYRAQLFNPDGTPNVQGRAKQIARLGAENFARVYKAVVQTYPTLRPTGVAGVVSPPPSPSMPPPSPTPPMMPPVPQPAPPVMPPMIPPPGGP